MRKPKRRALFEVSFQGLFQGYLLKIRREIVATNVGNAIAQFRRIYRTPNLGTDSEGHSLGYHVLHPADRRV